MAQTTNIPYEIDLLKSQNTHQTVPIYQYLTKYLIFPESQYCRFLIKHGTGLGKTRESLQIAKNFLDKGLPVFIFTFNPNIFINDMIKFWELDFVPKLLALRYQTEKDPVSLEQIKHQIHKEINSKVTFFGYKEFQNQIFWKEDNKFRINTILLNKMFNSLIICDEIHDVYNMEKQNTWGKSLQMVSNILQRNVIILYMSATPLNRPEEITSLLNLMYVDKSQPRLNRNDTLNTAQQFIVTQIEDIAGNFTDYDPIQIRAQIKEVMRNNLSFVPEVSINQPKINIIGTRYTFVAEPVLFQCPQTQLFKDNQQNNENFMHEDESKKYIIFDFPNRLQLKDFLFQLQKKSPECISWAEKNNFQVIQGDQNDIRITGQFLSAHNIQKYSPKLHKLLDLIMNSKGKSFIYINKVKLLGLKLIEQLMKVNGIIGINEHPAQHSICFQCRQMMKYHAQQQHNFLPFRFISLYGDQGRQLNEELLQKFNAVNNIQGQIVQVIIGSKMVKQGINILHTNNIFILNIPYNIPNLIQVLGRVVRTGSHSMLPSDERYVNVHILITSSEGGESQDLESNTTTREEREIMLKFQQYQEIQQFEQIMHEVAIDPEIYGSNYFIQEGEKMKQATTLKMLPFTPQYQFVQPADKSTYYQQKYYNDIIQIITSIMDQLFEKFKVWQYQELVQEIRNFNIIPDMSKIDDNIIYLVINNYPDLITKGEFLIKNSSQDIDINWFKPSQKKKKITKVFLEKQSDQIQFQSNIVKILKEFAPKYFNCIMKMTIINNSAEQLEITQTSQILENIFTIKCGSIENFVKELFDKKQHEQLMVLFLVLLPVSFKSIQNRIQFKTAEKEDTIIGFMSLDCNQVHYKIDSKWGTIQTEQDAVQVSPNHLVLTSDKTKVIRSNANIKNTKDKRLQFSGIVCETMMGPDVVKFAQESKSQFPEKIQKKQLCRELRHQFFMREINQRIQFGKKRFALLQFD